MASSMKDIKLRIKSVQSTMQITKAMELVASSKLRRAKERAEDTQPYFELLYESLLDIAAAAGGDVDSPYLRQRDGGKTCFVVIAGDRGLAGGYNNNIFRLVGSLISPGDIVLPIGKKAGEYYRKRGVGMLSEDFPLVEKIDAQSSLSASHILCGAYLRGEISRVVLAYTAFGSMLSQTAMTMDVLPVQALAQRRQGRALTLYEPGPETIFNQIIPDYVTGILFGAVCESLASELASRRNAMDSASKNAADMIDELSLRYNRARQGAITQELTEIVAGAEAQ